MQGPGKKRPKCTLCGGTSFVSRPCPPTAQPISRVVLTTDPRDECDEFRSVIRAEDGQVVWRCDRWKGVEFVLPRTDNVDAAQQLYGMGVPLSQETLHDATGVTPPSEEPVWTPDHSLNIPPIT